MPIGSADDNKGRSERDRQKGRTDKQVDKQIDRQRHDTAQTDSDQTEIGLLYSAVEEHLNRRLIPFREGVDLWVVRISA